MKKVDVFLKTVVDGMKVMAKEVDSLAEKLDGIAKERLDEKAKAKPSRKAPAKPKKVVEKKPVKKAVPKKAVKKVVAKKDVKKAVAKKPVTAVDTVLGIINTSKKGVDTATLTKKTGYNRKKVANLVFKLKKQGQIKSVGKGVYLKA